MALPLAGVSHPRDAADGEKVCSTEEGWWEPTGQPAHGEDKLQLLDCGASGLFLRFILLRMFIHFLQAEKKKKKPFLCQPSTIRRALATLIIIHFVWATYRITWRIEKVLVPGSFS